MNGVELLVSPHSEGSYPSGAGAAGGVYAYGASAFAGCVNNAWKTFQPLRTSNPIRFPLPVPQVWISERRRVRQPQPRDDLKRYKTILVSNGGGKLQPAPSVPVGWARQLRRILDVIDNQVRSLRARQIIGAVA